MRNGTAACVADVGDRIGMDGLSHDSWTGTVLDVMPDCCADIRGLVAHDSFLVMSLGSDPVWLCAYHVHLVQTAE
jgi:hypothetical protein